MRKLSRTRMRAEGGAVDWLGPDGRPQGVAGATVTSRPKADLDLSKLLSRQSSGATVTASEAVPVQTTPVQDTKSEPKQTVSLSDGTRITFATID